MYYYIVTSSNKYNITSYFFKFKEIKINANTMLIIGGSAGLGYALAKEFLTLSKKLLV